MFVSCALSTYNDIISVRVHNHTIMANVVDCMTLDTVKKSSLNNEEINLRSNCAYESRNRVTKKLLDLKATTSSDVSQIITEPNESYEPCTLIRHGFSTD